MDRVDDLNVVDPTQVGRCDAEMCVPELSLDDEQQNALARRLHSVSVSAAAARTGDERRRPGRRGATGHGITAAARPAAGGGRARGRTTRRQQSRAQLEPGIELLPRPAVHSDFAPLTTLAGANQDGAALAVKVGLAQRERLADPQPGAA
jgi:hypothetical protein